MEKTIICSFLISLAMGCGALAFFVWTVLSNQWDDTEDVKYRILEGEMEENDQS